jgi:hypothetical protein
MTVRWLLSTGFKMDGMKPSETFSGGRFQGNGFPDRRPLMGKKTKEYFG